MSIECSRWAWTVSGLTMPTKLVLLHLANRANPESHCAWPTVQGIRLDTGGSRRTVLRALSTLRELELIYPIGYGGATGQAVVYRLAGRWIEKRIGGGFLNWCPKTERWIKSDLPAGSARDAIPVASPSRYLSEIKSELEK